jgi:hypothetical protein
LLHLTINNMSKIKTITISNLKAISHIIGNFEGASCIIYGGNNKGKTTFCRGLFDRIRGLKPEMILKQNEKEGFAECELTTGEKFRWNFKEGGKESLSYTTDKQIKTNLTRSIADRFFPETFDVDKFLNDSPCKQRKTLQDLAGLDFADIDERFTESYKARTAANTRYQDARTIFEAMVMPEKIEPVEIAPLNEEKEKVRKELNNLYLKNKDHNEDLRKQWQEGCDKIRMEILDFNLKESERDTKRQQSLTAIDFLHKYGFDIENVMYWLNKTFQPRVADKVAKDFYPVEPSYIQELPDDELLKHIEKVIENAHESNRKAKLWQDWENFRLKKVDYYELSLKADEKVKSIEKERMDLIKTAKMPVGFSFTDEGIAYNEMPFNRQQLSSSSIYIAALKLGLMKIGEVRTLHFDASFLDNNSLAEIEAWANEQDLQLMIELPDREGGEITYEIIQQ